MSRIATSKPDSAFIGFVEKLWLTADNPMPLNDSDTARRDSANFILERLSQVVSEARDNNANFAWVQHFIHHLVL